MCLIAYVPDGRMLREDVLHSARVTNPDGIGVMSHLGVQRWVGKKAARKARRYIHDTIADRGIPYAVHWRFATHGAVNLENTHPFVTPNGAGTLMHNGVISFCSHDRKRSDTAQFCELLDDYPGIDDGEYMSAIENVVGYGNLLCILNRDGSFSLGNEDAGEWIDGVWYSNDYSLPFNMQTVSTQYWYRKDWRSDYATPSTSTAVATVADVARAGGVYDPLDWENDPRIKAKARTTAYAAYGYDDDDALDDICIDCKLPIDQCECDDTMLASESRRWLDRYDRDNDIVAQSDDEYVECLLPLPSGYRINSTADYYASLERDDDEAFVREVRCG